VRRFSGTWSTPRDGGATSDQHARPGHGDLDLGETAPACNGGESVNQLNKVRLFVRERT
jgi:hypothetical protein